MGSRANYLWWNKKQLDSFNETRRGNSLSCFKRTGMNYELIQWRQIMGEQTVEIGPEEHVY